MNLALSLASGVLLVLLFPRFSWVALAPFALVPLLVACARERNWKRRFLYGWASGFVFWFFVCIWIQFVLEVHGGMGRWGGWGAFVVFALLKALHTALFAALAGRLLRRPSAILTVSALWTAIEYAHGSLGLAWIGLGFAWLDLGNAGIDWPVLMRLAPITGVYGLSFAFAMCNCGLALVIQHCAHGLASNHSGGSPLRTWLIPLACLPLIALLPQLPSHDSAPESVNVIQANIDTEAVWTSQSLAAMEQHLADLSRENPAPFIVWPEAPAPFYPDRPAFLEYVSSVARSANADLLMSGIASDAKGAPLNSAFLLNRRGQLTGRYDKIQLVPFGEYIPPAFHWVNRITGEGGDFTPGTRIQTLQANGHRVGVFICYESAFPDLVRRFTLGDVANGDPGADVLVNLSNDGYFGDSAAREQHLSLVRMRAAENRRWILRSTNDGITAMIAPSGHVTETMPPFQQTARLMHYGYMSGETAYVQYGDWFAWVCLLFSAAGLAPPRRPRLRSADVLPTNPASMA
ncbi:MAG: apolipoprotein N-acyltransferase [Acidobacteriota bacterium]